MGAGYLLLCFVFVRYRRLLFVPFCPSKPFNIPNAFPPFPTSVSRVFADTFLQIPWTLFFTAEEGSLTLDLFNKLGTGGLTGPGRRRTIIAGQGVSRSQTNMNTVNNGYAGYGSPNAPTTNMGYDLGGGIGGGGIGGGIGGGAKDDVVRSQHSLNRVGDAQSMTSTGNRSGAGAVGQPPLTGATGTSGIPEASAPLMTGSSGEPMGSEQAYSYRARALYNCASRFFFEE